MNSRYTRNRVVKIILQDGLMCELCKVSMQLCNVPRLKLPEL